MKVNDEVEVNEAMRPGQYNQDGYMLLSFELDMNDMQMRWSVHGQVYIAYENANAIVIQPRLEWIQNRKRRILIMQFTLLFSPCKK